LLQICNHLEVSRIGFNAAVGQSRDRFSSEIVTAATAAKGETK